MRLKHNLVYICELFKKSKEISSPSMINAPRPNVFRYACDLFKTVTHFQICSSVLQSCTA